MAVHYPPQDFCENNAREAVMQGPRTYSIKSAIIFFFFWKFVLLTPLHLVCPFPAPTPGL